MKKGILCLLIFTSAFAMSGCKSAVKLADPPSAPAPRKEATQLTQKITVMSFNVRYKRTGKQGLSARKNGVFQTIRKEMPDSFGLQEATAAWRKAFKKELGELYGIACDTGRFYGMDEGVPIFYRLDRYELLEEGVFWLSDKPDKPSRGWDAPVYFRMAGYAVLQDKTTGFRYVHFNSHFDHQGRIARANSARLIADRVNAMNMAAVFTADVNDTPDSLPVEYLAAGGLTDLRSAKITDTGHTFHGYREREREPGQGVIDYICANQYLQSIQEFRVIREKYDGLYPSDHFAIVSTFTLAN